MRQRREASRLYNSIVSGFVETHCRASPAVRLLPCVESEAETGGRDARHRVSTIPII
ncbi:MAG: hypothetical protein VSS75_016330 [Candidatus Parabeggiatoa sp.]|nr:hypothetical protein [Candidatus Parabeggiatoa sp.]